MIKKMKADLHIHSRYSDGDNLIYEIAMHARKKDLDIVGIADHVGKGEPFEMPVSMFNTYIEDIEREDRFGLIVLKGIEFCGIESLKLLKSWQIKKLDYLLFEETEEHADKLGVLSRDLKKPVGLAHPDFSKVDWKNLGDVFIELNPRYLFLNEEDIAWNSFQKCWISVGSDAHALEHIGDAEVKRVYDIAKKYDLRQVHEREDFQEIIQAKKIRS